MPSIRLSIKGVIIKEGKLLVVTKRSADGEEYHILPGGGQDHGETVHDALRRECREEIGADVIIDELIFVRDYIGTNHEFAATDDAHQVELMFACRLAPGSTPLLGPVPDNDQTGIAWLEIDQLAHYKIYPKSLVDWLRPEGATGPIYKGDIN